MITRRWRTGPSPGLDVAQARRAGGTHRRQWPLPCPDRCC